MRSLRVVFVFRASATCFAPSTFRSLKLRLQKQGKRGWKGLNEGAIGASAAANSRFGRYARVPEGRGGVL